MLLVLLFVSFIGVGVVVVVEGYAKSVALASDTVSRVWVDMTSRVVGVNP